MEPSANPPDGGWGWMVVLGAALINMLNQAMFSIFGLVFGEELKAMAHGKATGITLVMSISVMVTNFSGLIVGPLLKKFSIRTITICGIICVGTGMIISSFSSQIWHIIIGYGFFTGLGLGVLASTTFLAINDYFTTKKSTAVGLAMAGTSLGQMIMPTFVGMLLKKYEFSGTTLIIGLINYSGIIGALFFRPICTCKKTSENDSHLLENGTKNKSPSDQDVNCNGDSKDVANKDNAKKIAEEEILLDGEKKLMKKKSKGIISQGMESNYKESAIEVANSQHFAKNTEGEEGYFKKIVKILDLTLLSDFTFVHLLIGLGLGYVSSVSFSTFFPMFLQDEVKFSIMETTSCMTALSFSDVLGRITVSEIFRRLHMSNKSSFMMGCILLAISRSCMMELSEFKSVLAAAFFVGYFRAITVINQNLVIAEYIKKEELPSAVGLNMVSKGLLILTIGQLLGLLKDEFSYGICIHLLNVILFSIVISWSLESMIRRTIK